MFYSYNDLKTRIENDLQFCNAELDKVKDTYLQVIFWESNHGEPFPDMETAVDIIYNNFDILNKMIETRKLDLMAVNSMLNN